MKHQEKMVNFYFGQGEQYLSESGEEMIAIADMHPNHAGNAARRLLTDAYTWAKDAGQDTRNCARWVLGSALFRALMAQATDPDRSDVRYQCRDCSLVTKSEVRAGSHAVVMGHLLVAA